MHCTTCERPLPEGARRDRVTCSAACRQLRRVRRQRDLLQRSLAMIERLRDGWAEPALLAEADELLADARARR